MRPGPVRPSALLLLATLLGATHDPLLAQREALQRAMRDELARSLQGLHLDTMPRPYFVAYRIDESDEITVAATRGSVLHSDHSRGRVLTVEVRVGDYSFDNTNFFAMPSGGEGMVLARDFFGGLAEVPLDDDYGALRRQLWLATDAAYKAAVQQYSRKRAAQVGAARTAAIPDFSRDDVTTTADTVPAATTTLDSAESLARRLSRTLGDGSDIEHSEVTVSARTVRTLYLNSEGTSFIRLLPDAEVKVDATTRAADGMGLGDAYAARAATLGELPSPDSLAAVARWLVSRLARRKQAATAEVYHGPVLFSGQAAAQVFEAFIGSRLLALRRPTSDIPGFEQLTARRADPFLEELGARVLPRFFSVADDPTLTTYAGHYVGGFRVDDDGVRTHATTVVDHGILKTLLSTRIPVRGVLKSSGNRRGGRPVVSTMVVTADSGLSEAALRQRLLALVRERGLPYGIIVRSLGGTAPSDMDNPFAFFAAMAEAMHGNATFEAGEAVRLYADGHEESMRGAAVSDLSAAAFRDVVAASRTPTVYSAPGGFPELPFELPAFLRVRETLEYQSTYVVPDLLFADVSVKGRSGEMPTLPVVPPPWASDTR